MSENETLIPLQRGSEYTVVESVGPFDQFERLIYVGDDPVYREGKLVSHALTFFDQQTGRTKALSLESLTYAVAACTRHFRWSGGWRRPDSGSVPAIDPKDYGPTEHYLESVVPYLKGLVEGDPNIENWFVWIARNEKLLESAMSPSQFLHFRYSPYDNACELLAELGIEFTRGVRHQWLRI